MTAGVVAIAAACAALACAALAAASWRALLRTGNGRIAWLIAGFVLLGAKSAMKSYRSFAGVPDSSLVESAFSVADLVAVVLLAGPILAGRREG